MIQDKDKYIRIEEDMPTGDKESLFGKSYGTLMYEALVYPMVHLSLSVCTSFTFTH